ncbi:MULTISPECIES: response regulator [Natrialbaceae]|uniref:response regulator n=1 Tax=Natrialbaceae TaxID=1644061 RepID=UPI00207D128A|nr:response regulator [Natronococcus sp. CG52]
MSEPKHVGKILLTEDNPGDVLLLKETFVEADLYGSYYVATDGDEALDFLHQRGDYADAPRPDIVFLDWYLPKKSGKEVLTELTTDETLEQIPVVVMTGTQPVLDDLKSERPRADAYVLKPLQPDELIGIVDEFSSEQ